MGYRTNVYVDGFNLYYGLLKDHPGRKWLNLRTMVELVRKKDNINRIRYFSAPVNDHYDEDEPVRQQTYLRALRTVPNLSIHLGQFQENEARRELLEPTVCAGCGSQEFPRHVTVRDPKEKGTDVSLATMLLMDAFNGDFNQAIIISNDSDLAMPVEMVRVRMELKIGILSPRPRVTARLAKAATFCGALRKGPVEASQFPTTLTDADGTITKPPHW